MTGQMFFAHDKTSAHDKGSYLRDRVTELTANVGQTPCYLNVHYVSYPLLQQECKIPSVSNGLIITHTVMLGLT